MTFDVAKAVQEVKAGKVEFRTDKTALVHVPVGKISFSPGQAYRERDRVDYQCCEGKTGGCQGKIREGLLLEFDHGAGDFNRY